MKRTIYVITLTANNTTGYHSVWVDYERVLKYVYNLNREYNKDGYMYLVRSTKDYIAAKDYKGKIQVKLLNSIGYMDVCGGELKSEVLSG